MIGLTHPNSIAYGIGTNHIMNWENKIFSIKPIKYKVDQVKNCWPLCHSILKNT